MTSILVKMPDYSPWFSAKIWKFLTLAKNDTIGKEISRGTERS